MVRKQRMRIAVIGAGVSGVAAAKCILDKGLDPVVFEQGTVLGGIWRYDEALPDGGGPAYRGLRTNTSKQTTAFSDFPFPAQLPDYPPRVDMLRYLDDYADHFGVRPLIRFRTEVVRVTPDRDGRWSVESRSAECSHTEMFDAVLVCSGVFRDPIQPLIKGAATFRGATLHSRDYTVPERFAGQTVLVVGSGSSATDAAVEISGVAGHVYMSVRGITPSVPPKPSSAGRFKTWSERLLPKRVRARLARHARLVWSRRFQLRRPEGPDAPFILGTPPFVPSEKLREPLAAGAVTLKPGIAYLDGDSVVFTDGSRTRVDTIVFATGYALSFPFLDPAIRPEAKDGLDLYRLVFPPEWPTLAFIGMFRVSGPAPPVAEMQARWAVDVVREAIRLPKPTTMHAAIATRRALIARTGSNPYRLNAEAYQDLLAAEIGALPRLWRHHSLWRAILAGPPLAAQYRLDGPNRWSGAALAVSDNQQTPSPPTLGPGEPVVAAPRTEQA